MKKVAVLVVICLFACMLLSACGYVPEPVAVSGLTVHFFHNSEENWYPRSPALVSSKEELSGWKSNAQRYWDGEGNEVRDTEFPNFFDNYSDEFFVDRQLLIIRFSAGSSGYRHKVTKFEYKDGTIFVDITKYVPGVKRGELIAVTTDMAYWIAVIELKTKYPADTFINVNGNGNGITAPKGFAFGLIENGTAYEVTVGESNASGYVVIPSEYNGLPVTRIGENAFYADTSLNEVVMPASVTEIGRRAFNNCTWLEKVVLPSVVTIGDHAFGGCKSLNNIDMSEHLANIGEWAFYQNESLTEVTVPSSVKTIGTGAFYECINLTTVTLHEGLESIGSGAFRQSKKITEISLPSTLTAIGQDAFGGFTAKQTVYVKGELSQAEADAKWGKDWRGLCSAKIIYEPIV